MYNPTQNYSNFIYSTLLIGFLLNFKLLNAQEYITGSVQDSFTGENISNAEIEIVSEKIFLTSDKNGIFLISKQNLPKEILLRISKNGYVTLEKFIKTTNKFLEIILLSPDPQKESQEISIISDLDFNSIEGELSQSAVGLLGASGDPYRNISTFNFSNVFFRNRGLGGRFSDVFVNGVKMNKFATGRALWANWGGLNNVTNNQQNTTGGMPMEAGIGSLNGNTQIDIFPSEHRDGWKLNISYARQHSYTNRVMMSYRSEESQSGWIFSTSSSVRTAQNSYIKGTNYKAYSEYIGIEKKWESHQFIFTGIAVFNERAGSSPGTSEVYGDPDLYYVKHDKSIPQVPRLQKNHYYNSYWGYQNNKKRNSRVLKIFEPFGIITHIWKPNKKSKVSSSIFYQIGFQGRTRLERYNRSNPLPDYYQNLPSYYISLGDVAKANKVAKQFNNKVDYRQINWKKLYASNRQVESIENVNGKGSFIKGRRSYYYLSEDRFDDRVYSFSSTVKSDLNPAIKLIFGINYSDLLSKNYKKVKDLLGGDYYLDRNPFAITSYSKDNNMLIPNFAAKKGDKVVYHYNIRLSKANTFILHCVDLKKIEYFFGGEISYKQFMRDGKFKNGSYPKDSFGKSRRLNAIDYKLKGGLTFNLGRHFLHFLGTYFKLSPSYLNSFISPRSNNRIIKNIIQEEISSFSGNYNIRLSKLKARATFYHITIRGLTQIKRFYIQGMLKDAFINEIVTSLDKRHIGLESAIEWNFTQELKLLSAISVGDYKITSRPRVSVINENTGEEEIINQTSYVKNFRESGTPQQAFSMGIEYKSQNYWWGGFNFNFFSRNFLDFTYITRTPNVYNNPNTGLPFKGISKSDRQLLKQRQLPSGLFLNINFGKSWYVNRKYYIAANASIRNALNNKDYITRGYEQARAGNMDIIRNNLVFTPKIYYALGRTFFINLSINF